MMEERKEHIHYSAEYIRRYLDGELSGPEMQALEKAALEDPFLSDAIEGLESNPEYKATLSADLRDIQQRLAERIKSKHRKKGILFALPNWQIAASVLFIIGLAIFTYTMIDRRTGRANLAKTTSADSGSGKSKQAPVVPSTGAVSPDKSTTGQDLAEYDSSAVVYQPPEKLKKSRVKDEMAVRESRATSQPVIDPKVKESNADSQPEREKISSIARNTDKVSIPPPKNMETALQGQVAGVEIQTSKAAAGKYVEGAVLDTAGNPIPFATVKLPGSKNGVSTDVNGFFNFYLKNGTKGNDIVIQSLGYEPYTGKIFPDGDTLNTFRLRKSPVSLDEVVVTALGVRKDDDDYMSYSPVDKMKKSDPEGWDSLYQYVDANKKIATADSVLKGQEIISFVVNKKGELSSFKIIKSVSPSHDAKIIQLIKSGPALKIQKGKKQKCQISIIYN